MEKTAKKVAEARPGYRLSRWDAEEVSALCFFSDPLAMPITVTCWQCGHRLVAPDALARRKAKCSVCAAELNVPPPVPVTPPDAIPLLPLEAPAPPQPTPAPRSPALAQWHIQPPPVRGAGSPAGRYEQPDQGYYREPPSDYTEPAPERRWDDWGPLQPHRGLLILLLGIAGLTFFLPLGVAAWILANNDLRAMQAGLMDRQGEGMTHTGKVCGMIATIGCVVALCLVFFWFGVVMSMVHRTILMP
jgi:hypothetical protein